MKWGKKQQEFSGFGGQRKPLTNGMATLRLRWVKQPPFKPGEKDRLTLIAEAADNATGFYGGGKWRGDLTISEDGKRLEGNSDAGLSASCKAWAFLKSLKFVGIHTLTTR